MLHNLYTDKRYEPRGPSGTENPTRRNEPLPCVTSRNKRTSVIKNCSCSRSDSVSHLYVLANVILKAARYNRGHKENPSLQSTDADERQ